MCVFMCVCVCVCVCVWSVGRTVSVTDIESRLWGPSVWLWPSSSPSHLQRGGRRSVCVCVCVCVCVWERSGDRQTEREKVLFGTIQYVHTAVLGTHTLVMWTRLLLWRCWLLAEGTHTYTHTATHSPYTHSLHSAHLSYSQREPQVSPLALGQLDLWPFKHRGIPGRRLQERGGDRGGHVKLGAAVNI